MGFSDEAHKKILSLDLSMCVPSMYIFLSLRAHICLCAHLSVQRQEASMAGEMAWQVQVLTALENDPGYQVSDPHASQTQVM